MIIFSPVYFEWFNRNYIFILIGKYGGYSPNKPLNSSIHLTNKVLDL